MTVKYRDFIIQEQEWKCTNGKENFTIINYLVYKEIDGEKYFLEDVTAFDTMEEAKEVIDELLLEEDFEIKYAVDIINSELHDSVKTLLVTEEWYDAYRLCDKWNEENATDTLYSEVFELDCKELYNNDNVENGYVKCK